MRSSTVVEIVCLNNLHLNQAKKNLVGPPISVGWHCQTNLWWEVCGCSHFCHVGGVKGKVLILSFLVNLQTGEHTLEVKDHIVAKAKLVLESWNLLSIVCTGKPQPSRDEISHLARRWKEVEVYYSTYIWTNIEHNNVTEYLWFNLWCWQSLGNWNQKSSSSKGTILNWPP